MELQLSVPGMTCGHCEAAVRAEVAKVFGVTGVEVDLVSKLVVVRGDGLEVDAVCAAIDEAGFDAVPTGTPGG